MTFMDKDTILKQLQEKHLAVIDYVQSLDEQSFEYAPEGKWSAGQQLIHLFLSIKDLTMATGLPKLAWRGVFGKAKRPSRTFDEIVEVYKNALGNGGKASKEYIPRPTPFAKKGTTIEKTKNTALKLCKHLQKVSLNDLDYYTVPHPLLGTMTLKEVLFFTIYHVEYHHKSIQDILSTKA